MLRTALRLSSSVFNRPYWNVNYGTPRLRVMHWGVFNRPYWNVNGDLMIQKNAGASVFNRPYWNVNFEGMGLTGLITYSL